MKSTTGWLGGKWICSAVGRPTAVAVLPRDIPHDIILARYVDSGGKYDICAGGEYGAADVGAPGQYRVGAIALAPSERTDAVAMQLTGAVSDAEYVA
jgi:hypothetical protein